MIVWVTVYTQVVLRITHSIDCLVKVREVAMDHPLWAYSNGSCDVLSALQIHLRERHYPVVRISIMCRLLSLAGTFARSVRQWRIQVYKVGEVHGMHDERR